MKYDPDDPRLTAFALGELSEHDQQDVEAMLAEDPEARRLLDELRLTAQWLAEGLKTEQANTAPLGPVAREKIEATLQKSPDKPSRWRWYRSPSVLSGIAAMLLLALLFMPAQQSARESAPRVMTAAKAGKAIQPGAVISTDNWGERSASANSVLAPARIAVNSGTSTGSHESSTDRYAALQDQAGKPALNAPAFTPGVRTEVPLLAKAPPAPARGTARGAVRGMGGYGGMMGGGMASTTGDGSRTRGLRGRVSGESLALNRAMKEKESLGRSVQDDLAALSDQASSGKDQMAYKQQGRAKLAQAASSPAGGPNIQRESEPGERSFALRLPPSEAKETAQRALSAKAIEPAAAKPLEPADNKNELHEQRLDAAPVQEAPAAVAFDKVVESPFRKVLDEPLSTFSIDVDTASYAIVRRFLLQGNQLPPQDAVRIEEMLNYFPYQDAPPPTSSPDPFAIHVEVSRCPWNAQNRLARIGIAGKPIPQDKRKPSNLVFLIDVSGSMDQPNKLPLVQWSLQRLVEQLGENDRVAIVVYAGASGLVLPSTSCLRKAEILSAIEQLHAGGSTNGGAGIQLAYDLAVQNFIQNGTNRVILATDGDFNVGTTGRDALIKLIEQKSKSNVFFTVLGFGMDNLKDGTLEQLADKGNGHYAFIDSQDEAFKTLVREMGSTLETIAKDVKIQVEFNPAKVGAYRLIGYENRALANEDFDNDAKDAGEIGAGHHVAALYELLPAGMLPPGVAPRNSRYMKPAQPVGNSSESFTVSIRYKPPTGSTSTKLERAVVDKGLDYAQSSDDFKFASTVAAFGMLLRGSPAIGNLSYAAVLELAIPTLAHDPSGYRKELVEMIRKARDLSQAPAP